MIPSVNTLSRVFSDPKMARKILEMTHKELEAHPVGAARIAECLKSPKWCDVRLHILASLQGNLYGIESAECITREHAHYINTGETYKPTVIYWRSRYRVQSLGDFVESNRLTFK